MRFDWNDEKRPGWIKKRGGRHDEDGTRTRGRFVNREFVAAR